MVVRSTGLQKHLSKKTSPCTKVASLVVCLHRSSEITFEHGCGAESRHFGVYVLGNPNMNTSSKKHQ
eukprot:1257234-Amphidinium_carterae.1